MRTCGRGLGYALLPIGVIALALALYFRFWSHEVDRRVELRKELAAQEANAERAVREYTPTIKGRIDDLTVRADDLLRSLPGVVEVEVHQPSDGKSLGRIIHVRDWHYVPKELFIRDQKAVRGRDLSLLEIDDLYDEHLLEIDIVQVEHMAALRCLIHHHGLTRVFAEGLTDAGRDVYRERIRLAKEIEDDFTKQEREVTAVGGEKANAILQRIKTIRADHKRDALLELGAIGRLLVSGDLREAVPLDDPLLLDADNPVQPDGQVRRDRTKRKARNDAHVRAVMKHGSFGLLVLGGSHDLTESVRALAPQWEYLRVTTRQFRSIAD